MIPGVTITMGGRDWLIPPLTLGQLRRLMPKVRQLTEIGASMGEAQIGVLVEIVAAAVQRNYPDATADMVENLLDLGNANAVLNAVLTGSGLKSRDSRRGGSGSPRAQPGGRLSERGGISGLGPESADGWGHIYGLLATACGYSYPVIDEMTLFDFEELTAYWAEHPPVHILVGAYLGVGRHQRRRIPSARPSPPSAAGPDLQTVLAELGPGFGAGDVHAGLPRLVLDFAELQRRERKSD